MQLARVQIGSAGISRGATSSQVVEVERALWRYQWP